MLAAIRSLAVSLLINGNFVPMLPFTVVELTGKSTDKGVILASAQSEMFGYTKKEHFESIVTVSTERKHTCPANRSTGKSHHIGPLMKATGQKKHSSTTLLTGTTRRSIP